MVAPVLIALHRVGPYHHARFQAAAAALPCPLLVLQTRPQSQEYPWSFVVEGAAYTLLSLEGALSPEQDPPRSVLCNQLEELLERYRPSVIMSVGWADRSYLQLLRLGQSLSIPVVVVSDSRLQDSIRSPLKEWCKSQLLRGYSAGLVAGLQSRQYLVRLGMPANVIQQPWDVVDNQLFAQLKAKYALSAPPQEHRPFICVGRFIPEKNHALLLEAFSHYQQQGGNRQLLLVGHGKLKQHIQAACAQLPRPDSVKLIPFAQQMELGKYYSHSHALVLPSSKDTWGLVVNEAIASGLPVIVSRACGCAADLVEDNITGWSFDFYDSKGLAKCLQLSDEQLPEDRLKMTSLALNRLDQFSPKSFASAVAKLYSHSFEEKRFSARSYVASLLLSSRIG